MEIKDNLNYYPPFENKYYKLVWNERKSNNTNQIEIIIYLKFLKLNDNMWKLNLND